MRADVEADAGAAAARRSRDARGGGGQAGAARCGLPPGPPAVAPAERMAAPRHLSLGGLQAYRGSAPHLRDPERRRAAIAAAGEHARRISSWWMLVTRRCRWTADCRSSGAASACIRAARPTSTGRWPWKSLPTGRDAAPGARALRPDGGPRRLPCRPAWRAGGVRLARGGARRNGPRRSATAGRALTRSAPVSRHRGECAGLSLEGWPRG